MADSRAVTAAKAAGFTVGSGGKLEQNLSGPGIERLRRTVQTNGGELSLETPSRAASGVFWSAAGKAIKITADTPGAAGNRLTFAAAPPADDNQAHALAITSTPSVHAAATLNPTGNNNSILWTAAEAGADGNDIRITYTQPTDTNVAVPLALAKNGSSINVTLGVVEDGSTVRTTAQDLIDAVTEGYVASARIDFDSTGNDNIIRFEAVTPGAAGNDITVRTTVPVDDNQAHDLSLSAIASAITIQLAVDTDGSTILTTADDVIAAVTDEEDPAYDAGVAALVTAVGVGTTTGVMAAKTATALQGGAADVFNQDIADLVVPAASGDVTGVLAAVSVTALTGGVDADVMSVSLQVDTDGSTVLTTAAALVTALNLDADFAALATAELDEAGDHTTCRKNVLLNSTHGLRFVHKTAGAPLALSFRRVRGKAEAALSSVTCHVKHNGELVEVVVPAGKTIANIKTAMEAHTATNALVTITAIGTQTGEPTFDRRQDEVLTFDNEGSTVLTTQATTALTGGVDGVDQWDLLITPAEA